ncbi:MAG: glycosyltransferase [Deltaproteobacteria bacterium]|nr:glycosyltransferase [Deltaproteobacteria bacterium]
MWSIVHTEWSDGFGGQEHRILLECREMIRRGHRVRIACRPDAVLFPKAREAGIPVTPVPIRSSADLPAVRTLFSLFRRERVQVVNTHSGKASWVASIAAKIAGVPLLIRTRHISVPVRRGFFNMIYRWPDGYITTGEMIRDHLIGKGIPANRVISIPTGVDLTRFSAGANGSRIREEWGIAPGTFLVSMIGVLRSWKRHDVFLEAVRLLKEQGVPIRAFVVGEGPRRDVIEAEIREKGISDVASITGYREDIPEILAASDAVVLSSDRFEGVPQAILQAMAMARPGVAAPVGGIPEVVRHEETGLLCRVGDPASFADAITRLRDDPSLGRSMGASGRKIVLASYSLAAMGEKTEAFYTLLALSGKRIA